MACCSAAVLLTVLQLILPSFLRLQKPRVIEIRGATRSTGSSSSKKAPSAAAAAASASGSAPAAAGAASAVNVTSSGSGAHLGHHAAAPVSPKGGLLRAQTVAGDGRHMSRMGAGQAGSVSLQSAAAANRQQQRHSTGHPVSGSGSFFLPGPLDVDFQQQQQQGSFVGTGGSSSSQGKLASQLHNAAFTPPPSPAVAPADAGRGSGPGFGPHEVHSRGGGQAGADAAAGVRASHSGLGTRHSGGGGGAVTVFDRKVYVSVYADGPTKVLCFSDDPLWTGSNDADEGGDTLQLLSRLHHVARQLMSVDRQLELYQGAAYGLKPGRGSRAVPALLLLQHQQQLAAGGAAGLRRGSMLSAGGGGGGGSGGQLAVQQQQGQQQQELPVLLQGAASSAAGAGSTTTAALALLQQMGRPAAAQQQSSQAAAVGRGTIAAVGVRGSDSVSDAIPWPSAATAAALGIGSHAYAGDAIDGVSEVLIPPAVRISMLSPQTAFTQSHISARPLAGAAAAAAAGVRVAGGLLGAEGGMEGGVKLYYDKLTLLLDSQLPLGGNVKVSSKAASLLDTGIVYVFWMLRFTAIAAS